MILLEAIQRVADGVNLSNVSDRQKEQILRKINLAVEAVAKNYFWKDLERSGQLALVPNYTSGTASISNGSRTVTIASGTVTNAMKGRFFKHENSGGWYRIVNVDTGANTLILEVPIQESSASGLTYEVWKKFYRVNSDVRLVLPCEFPNQQFNNYPYNSYQYNNSVMFIPFTIHSVDEYAGTYTTGSVSLTQDSNVVTGSSTVFFDNVFAGDRLRIGNNKYFVQRVESDTRLILQNYSIEAYDGSYVINSDYPRTAVLNFTTAESSVLNYSYVRRVYDLINERFDTFPFPREFDTIIIDHAIGEFKKDTGDVQWPSILQLATSKLETLRKNSDLEIKPFRQMKAYIPGGNGRGISNTQYIR